MADAATQGRQSVSVAEHPNRILRSLEPLSPVLTPLALAQGRTLAVDVFARVDVPGFDSSAMDGYAVLRSERAASETLRDS